MARSTPLSVTCMSNMVIRRAILLPSSFSTGIKNPIKDVIVSNPLGMKMFMKNGVGLLANSIVNPHVENSIEENCSCLRILMNKSNFSVCLGTWDLVSIDVKNSWRNESINLCHKLVHLFLSLVGFVFPVCCHDKITPLSVKGIQAEVHITLDVGIGFSPKVKCSIF